MTAETGRVIRLRRPPVFNVVPDRWIPESIDLESVDEAWAALCGRNPRYHDGDVFHVLGVVDVKREWFCSTAYVEES